MIGYDIKCKYQFSYDDSSLDMATDVMQLDRDTEVGEIINNYWLIVNSHYPFGNPVYEYPKGQYVKVKDIRRFDVFVTDFNYDGREDLIKLRTQTDSYYDCSDKTYKQKEVNVYGYK
jgi:hypothetical protein